MAGQPDSLLGGYRVLDLTDEKGLLCGKILGDLGADVIKIEPPGGDPARNIGPFYKDIPHPEKSLFWFFTNLNKKGITLDIETPDGKDIFKRLAKSADFVVESFEPSYMESLGLGYSELEKINPRIIMTSITPFGQTGPYADYKATDLVGVSIGGLLRLFGELDRPPNRISAPQFYFLGGLHGAVGSMVAYYHRELTGEGQYVDVSCQQATVLSVLWAIEVWDLMKFNFRGMGSGRLSPRPAPLGPLFVRCIHPCKDGHVFFFLTAGASPGGVKSCTALVEMANQEGMCLELKDYEWSQLDTSTISQEEMDRIAKSLGEFFQTKTKAELLQAGLEKAIWLMPVCTAKDLVESPQLAAREFWAKVDHPELEDTISYPGFPVQMRELPPFQPQRAPLIGEHNQEVYQELGLSQEELVLLKNRGVI